MKRFIPVILIAVLMIGFPVSAEFYKYYDEDGNVHFTDDYNKVPLDQREDVEGYEESISEEPPPEEAQEAVDTEAAEEEDSEIASTEEYDIDAKVSEFEERKAEIEQEYQSLVKEKERLDEMLKKIKTQKQLKASGYNESMQALNERMAEHDRKRQDLISEIEAHNARLSEKKASQKQTSTQSKATD
jgi:hypothetical protein